MRLPLPAALLLATSVAACSEDPVVLVLDITPGHETDAFSAAPPVTRVDVTGASPEGDILVGASSAPGGTFDLGEVPEDRLLSFEVTGYDASSAVAVRGRSLGVVIGAIDSEVLPIFAQRLGTWSRPPDAVGHAHVGGVAGVLGERYLLSTGGQVAAGSSRTASAPAYYDLLTLAEAVGNDFPRSAASLLLGVDGSTALLIDGQGATWVDFLNGSSSDVVLPAGLTSF
ncbi:MAG: hypothetical protein JRI23_27945, partial [Deltaproteobacteria bacterium]|nr:hypothetical protein [Deltaproteobacteria bacterium]MBW2535924.1 hypothetical protein [Deltaproteobacteria bacterium]